MNEEEKRAQFRAEFPESAAAADLFRELFGPGVRLLYAEENGKTVGRQYDEKKHAQIYKNKKGTV